MDREPPVNDAIDKIIDLVSGKPLDQLAWTARLARSEKGEALATVSNMMLIFANDPVLRGMLAYNAFTADPLIMRPAPVTDDGQPILPGPYPRLWGAADATLVQAYLQRVWSPRVTPQTVDNAMLAEATLRQFHPIVDWLNDLRWDGLPRVDTWLSAAFDAENSRFHRAAGSKLLIAAVRRVKLPGIKFDQMLVLEGPQGIGKSRALRNLFGDAWFSDAVPPDLSSKDAAMALLGVWGLEFAEIEHLIRAEVETIKAFLSRSVDRYRPPYGKGFVERPRQGVLIGTTNSDDYLRDTSGNRRIWPIRCRSADPDWVHVNREQLWAEAAVREAAREPIWLDDEELRQDASIAQSDRLTVDPWSSSIARYVRGKHEVEISDILFDAISMTKDKMNKTGEMRVGAVLKELGWTKRRPTINGVRATIWKPPVPPEAPDEMPF